MKQIYSAALVSLLALSGCLDGTNPFMGSDEPAPVVPDPVEPDPDNPVNAAGIP